MTGESLQVKIVLLSITTIIWLLLHPWRWKLPSLFPGMFSKKWELFKQRTTPFIAMIILWILFIRYG